MSTRAEKPPANRSRLRGNIVLCLVALLTALFVRAFLLQTFFIPSDSMEQTLIRDDHVIVNKIGHRFGGPDRGQIVVFRPPAGWHAGPNEDYIKRVVGVGGDHVVCCDDRDRITVNGVALDENYLYPGNRPSDEPFDVIVPADSVFVLGDHRGESGDSRFHLDVNSGSVPVDRVVGRAFVLFWPPSRGRVLSVPGTFADVPEPH